LVCWVSKKETKGLGFGFVNRGCKTTIITEDCLASQQQSKVLDRNASVHEIAG
jgi:hypothetical protein